MKLKKDAKDLINNVIVTVVFFMSAMLIDYFIKKIWKSSSAMIILGWVFVFGGIAGLINDGQFISFFSYKNKVICIIIGVIGILIIIMGIFDVIANIK